MKFYDKKAFQQVDIATNIIKMSFDIFFEYSFNRNKWRN